MSDKGLFAVMRYSSVDDYLKAQESMTDFAGASEFAEKKAASDPERVYVIVKVLTVVPGAQAPLIMKTVGEKQ